MFQRKTASLLAWLWPSVALQRQLSLNESFAVGSSFFQKKIIVEDKKEEIDRKGLKGNEWQFEIVLLSSSSLVWLPFQPVAH